MKLSEKRIARIVSVLQKLYLASALILSIIFIPALFGERSMQDLIAFGLLIILNFSIYFGLKTKQPLIVPVMVVLAILGILGQLFISADQIVLLAIKILILGINIFELYFFTRKDVKKYFKVKGNFLLGV